jgi:hypothetical protein
MTKTLTADKVLTKSKAKPKTPVRNLSQLSRDTGYRFTDRDPILELVTRIITDSGWSLKAIESKSGVCSSTLRKWQNGETRRPQNATVDMVMRILGYTRKVFGPDGKEFIL